MCNLPHEFLNDMRLIKKFPEKLGIENKFSTGQPKAKVRHLCQKIIKRLLQNIPEKHVIWWFFGSILSAIVTVIVLQTIFATFYQILIILHKYLGFSEVLFFTPESIIKSISSSLLLSNSLSKQISSSSKILPGNFHFANLAYLQLNRIPRMELLCVCFSVHVLIMCI